MTGRADEVSLLTYIPTLGVRQRKLRAQAIALRERLKNIKKQYLKMMSDRRRTNPQ
jgi:hypothetical protein